jgi:GNAT superfamily N-acetyltransferase
MATVLQYVRELQARPDRLAVPGIDIRHYGGEEDIDPWLSLRQRAFARQGLGVRAWDRHDFQREFLDRWWWRPERMWLAEAAQPSGEWAVVGTVTLAMRGPPERAVPAVHWLAVLPTWRDRGVGRLLMSVLESAAWDAGYRTLYLETHAAWTAAVRLYEALGYHRSTPASDDQG